jgi:hypothetical protein
VKEEVKEEEEDVMCVQRLETFAARLLLVMLAIAMLV